MIKCRRCPDSELSRRVKIANSFLDSCILCPNNCRVNRLSGKTGFCNAGIKPKVSAFLLHNGEEPPISGSCGSGTIFFSHCTMQCRFCQNYQISQLGEGKEKTIEELAGAMLELQSKGAHNINLVSPTHYMPQILSALEKAFAKGLEIPLVYNTNGYESVEILRLLDGIIDIYLPDIKYSDEKIGRELSGAKNYPANNCAAIREMFRQAGNLQCDENNIAVKGVLVRHLVLPEGLAGSYDSLRFLAENFGTGIKISVMAQYHPCYKAGTDKKISRRIKATEYQQVLDWAEELGLENRFTQELGSSDAYLPDFSADNIFSARQK